MKKKKGFKDNTVKYGTISLPQPLINKIKEKIKGTGISSVSSYIAFVLRQILASEEQSKNLFSKKEEENIKRNLKNLGYI